MKEFQLSCSFDAFKDTVQTQIEKFEALQRQQINNIEELQTSGFQIAGARKSTEAEIKEFRESCKNYISSLNCQQ